MANHQYITVRRPAGCFYVEGTYSPDFIAFLKTVPVAERKYEPEAKRWKIDIKHLNSIVNQARVAFDRVMYCEGCGDYDEITICGTTYTQVQLIGGE